jgi:hypothetical protein
MRQNRSRREFPGTAEQYPNYSGDRDDVTNSGVLNHTLLAKVLVDSRFSERIEGAVRRKRLEAEPAAP